MKSILLPTDFSPVSRNAALRVFELFKNISDEIRLTLLTAYLVPNIDPENAVLINDQIKEKALSKLSIEKGKILKLAGKLKVHIDITAYMGSVENVVPEVLRKTQFDLVVMGKNGGEYIDKISKSLKRSGSNSSLLIVYSGSDDLLNL